MNERDQKLFALIVQFRHAANEATTADSAVTYRDCADALEAAVGIYVLVAVCEGCGMEVPMPTKNARKANPDVPVGWSQWGVSKHRRAGHGKRLAAWCPDCRAKRSA